ncbi:hypothetical protein HCN44_006994 [Aphidius gifuensis]|uniref:Uncharacterized protein n=1 Tax=Aphidius gifuensis TaxID=684658 RepID=A0A834Y370_APHGI|nr:hypothetical protein HCN44_006994 [Aphidius gifuensis]
MNDNLSHIEKLIDIYTDQVIIIIDKLNNNNYEYKLLASLYNISQFKDDDCKFTLTTELLEKYSLLMYQIEPNNVVNHIANV